MGIRQSVRYFAILTILSTVVLIGQSAPPPAPSCTIAAPCSFSTNIAWNSAGNPPSTPVPPGVWGTQDVVYSNIPFLNVPSGYHVRIVAVSGDMIAAPHGTPTAGSVAYVLIGLTNTTPFQSPYVSAGLGSTGCFLYKQGSVGPSGTRIPIQESVQNGDLNKDNVLIVKQAIFLNEFGLQAPVHTEATLVITFAYVLS